MALDTGNYISDFDRANPTSSDPVSEGDDVLRFVKKVLQKTFPMGTDAAGTATGVGPNQAVQVIIAKATAPTIGGTVAESHGLVWLDTTTNLLKIRNKANDAWITLAVNPEVSNSVDINAGTIDGAVIGGSTPAAISGTTLSGSTSLALATGATVTGVDNGTIGTSATLLATQGAIKTYVDAQVTAQDLDITTDSGTIDIDLDSDTLTVAGGSGLDTAASSTTVTVNVTDGGVTNAKLADMAANTVKVRNANSSGVPSDVALATTEILIGDGTGFTAAALSGDATMTNAGAVSVVKIQGQDVSATAATDDQYLKYSTASSEWQKVSVLAPDRLTTKGDLLVYNTVDSETRLPVGTNDYVLAADSSATNGVDWQQLATAGIADNAVTLGKLEDGTQGDILYYGASGAPTRLGFGTSGYVLKTQGTGANPAWAADTDTTYTAGDGLDLTGTAFSTDLKSGGGLAISSTELTMDFTSDNAWTGSQRATAVTDNDGSYDMDAGQNFITTPAAAVTITFTNIANGQSGFVKLINSGGETISLHANSKGDANLATTVTTAGTYLLSYFSDGTDVWLTNSEIYA